MTTSCLWCVWRSWKGRQPTRLHACQGGAGCPAYPVFALTILKWIFSLLPPTTCQNKKHPVICLLLLPLVVFWGSIFSKMHHGKRQSYNDLDIIALLEASLDSLNEINDYSSWRAAFSHFAAANRWEEWLTVPLEVVKWTGLSATQYYKLHDALNYSHHTPPHRCFACLHALHMCERIIGLPATFSSKDNSKYRVSSKEECIPPPMSCTQK